MSLTFNIQWEGDCYTWREPRRHFAESPHPMEEAEDDDEGGTVVAIYDAEYECWYLNTSIVLNDPELAADVEANLEAATRFVLN